MTEKEIDNFIDNFINICFFFVFIFVIKILIQENTVGYLVTSKNNLPET